MSGSHSRGSGCSFREHYGLLKPVVCVVALIATSMVDLFSQSGAYEFGLASLRSLQLAIEADSRRQKPSADAGDLLTTATLLAADRRLAARRLIEASENIKRFVSHPNSDIAAGAKEMANAYLALAAAYNRTSDVYQKFLSVTRADQVVDILVDVEEEHRTLGDTLRSTAVVVARTTTLNLYRVTVDYERSAQERRMFFRITAEQRSDLVNALRILAGSRPEELLDDKRPYDLQKAAAEWWQWLSDQNYQSAR